MKPGDYNIACDDFQKWQKIMGEALSSATAWQNESLLPIQLFIGLAADFHFAEDPPCPLRYGL